MWLYENNKQQSGVMQLDKEETAEVGADYVHITPHLEVVHLTLQNKIISISI